MLANLVACLGPPAVGLLSNALGPTAGREALRWPLVALVPPGPWSACQCVVAARALAAEGPRATPR